MSADVLRVGARGEELCEAVRPEPAVGRVEEGLDGLEEAREHLEGLASAGAEEVDDELRDLPATPQQQL